MDDEVKAVRTSCSSDDQCDPGFLCVSKLCAPGCSEAHACKGQEACCSGACADLKNDPQHCGACAACAIGNAKAACRDSVCAIESCPTGFVDCDGKAENGCEVSVAGVDSVPSPNRPVMGDYTGSLWGDAALKTLRPTFKWRTAVPKGCAALSYQIQLDDSCGAADFARCTFPSPEIDTIVAMPSFTPTAPLVVSQMAPVGTRYYWRVRSCDIAKTCSGWSPIHYVNVGRLRDDINGDGYSDLLARGGGGNGYVYLGGKTPGDQPASHGMGIQGFGFVGDINADGDADFAVADDPINPMDGGASTQNLRVYYGRSGFGAELGTANFGIVTPIMGNDVALSTGGDFNADGYDDFPMWKAAADAARVFLGSSAPIGAVALSLRGDKDNPAHGAGRTGDIDGDGFADLAEISPVGDASSATIYFYHGGPSPTNSPFRSESVPLPLAFDRREIWMATESTTWCSPVGYRSIKWTRRW